MDSESFATIEADSERLTEVSPGMLESRWLRV
jgi:hypothetical protein